MRLRFESALIGEGAEIRVSEGNLTLPGSLRLGGSEELRLSKAGVDRIDLGVSDKGMICSLTFALKDGPTLRFGAGSIENPAALATALGEHFGVPANKQTYSFYANHLETLLAGGLALLGVAVVYALFL
jgi:hypothetical protein